MWLWLLAAGTSIVVGALAVCVGRWVDAPLMAEPAHVAPPPPGPVRKLSAFRLVLVTMIDGGVVLDGLVERGPVLGWPGSTVTLLLEVADPCALAATVKELQGWAAVNAVVEIELVTADGGVPAAALRSGHDALRLPILGLTS